MPRKNAKKKYNLDLSPEEFYKTKMDPWNVEHDEYEWRKARDIESFINPAHNVLDFGCGEGVFTNFYRDQNYGLFAGCDVSKTAIKRARERYGDYFFVHDIRTRLPKEHRGRFDCILLNEVLYYIKPSDLKIAIYRCIEALKKGGRVIVTCGQYFTEKDIRYVFDGLVEFTEVRKEKFKKGYYLLMVGRCLN